MGCRKAPEAQREFYCNCVWMLLMAVLPLLHRAMRCFYQRDKAAAWRARSLALVHCMLKCSSISPKRHVCCKVAKGVTCMKRRATQKCPQVFHLGCMLQQGRPGRSSPSP